MSFVFNSKYQKRLKERLINDWVPSGSAVSILQGFPGTGKSSIAREVGESTELETIYLEVSEGSGDIFGEFYLDLATELDPKGIDLLSMDISNGKSQNLIYSVINTLIKHPILVVIDDFQYCLDGGSGLPTKQFQDLVEKINKSSAVAGKLILISNKNIKTKRWNDNCFLLSVDGLQKDERGDFFLQALSQKNLLDKIPSERIDEIAARLDGNPRAILTLVSSLFYDSIEELLSLSPDLFEAGDTYISQNLILEFEQQLVQRSISLIDSNLRELLEYLSVYRKPFVKMAYESIPVPNIEIVRHDLIDRYFIHSTSRGDYLHPVAKEVFISQVQKTPAMLEIANNLAAEYYLSSFKISDKAKHSTVSARYFELRHHLIQCNRVSDIGLASTKVKRYLLAKITKPQQSEVPNREILEERIALISLMPEGERPKEFEYHLALCLRERNKYGDYKKALHHIRRAASPNIYYAAWLLRLDLEYSVEGVDAMSSALEESLKFLRNDNNVFAIYRRCAELLHKNGQPQKAIAVLERGIQESGAHCYTSIAPLCADYMVEQGQIDDAISLLLNCIATKGVTRVVTLYTRCAELMAKESRYDEATNLLEKALSIPNITKLYSLRTKLADIVDKSGNRKSAIAILKNGIEDDGKEDTSKLRLKCAELMISEREIEGAISLLNDGADNKSKNQSKILVALAENLKNTGHEKDGIELLKNVLSTDSLFDKKIIYVKCADMLFADRDLDGAAAVLKDAISDRNIIDKWDFYKKYSDILYRQEKIDQAIEILKAGTSDKNCSNTYVLYKAGAKILVKEGRLDDAIRFVEEGLDSSALKDKATLCQELSNLLARNNNLESAIDILEDAIREPGMKKLPELYKTCAELHNQNSCPEKAVAMLEQAILNIPSGNIAPLYKLASEILYNQENIGQAYYFISKGRERYPKDQMLKMCLERLQSDQSLSKFAMTSNGALELESTMQESIIKIKYFQQLIEYQDCYKNFYYKGELRADEAFVQNFFKAVWAESKSSVDSEVKNGRGIVDFKISYGRDDCTLIEFKLGSSTSLKRNIEHQTEIYKKVNQTDNALTVIVVFTDKDSLRVSRALKATQKENDENIYIIDARRDNKPSASIATCH